MKDIRIENLETLQECIQRKRECIIPEKIDKDVENIIIAEYEKSYDNSKYEEEILNFYDMQDELDAIICDLMAERKIIPLYDEEKLKVRYNLKNQMYLIDLRIIGYEISDRELTEIEKEIVKEKCYLFDKWIKRPIV